MHYEDNFRILIPSSIFVHTPCVDSFFCHLTIEQYSRTVFDPSLKGPDDSTKDLTKDFCGTLMDPGYIVIQNILQDRQREAPTAMHDSFIAAYVLQIILDVSRTGKVIVRSEGTCTPTGTEVIRR